jgi:hypothetical protein
MGLFDQATSQPNQGLMGLGQQPQNMNWQQGPAALSGGISQETAMPNFMGQLQGNMPQESYGVPSPFMNQGAMQGAMLSDADRREMNPNSVAPNYTAQDLQTAMKNPEFDSVYYQNANVLDDQGNPLSMDAKQQLIQPFYNQQQQLNPAMQAPTEFVGQFPQQPQNMNWQQGPAALSGGISEETAQPNFMGMSDAPFNPAMGMPQGNMPPMQQYGETPFAFNEVPSFQMPTNSDWKSNPELAMLGGDMGVTIYKQPDGTYRDDSGKPTDYSQYNQRINRTPNTDNPQQPQRIPSQSFFEGPNAGRVPQGFQMVNGEMVRDDSYQPPTFPSQTLPTSTTPALNPTPQPPQIFQPMPQTSNLVNTQTVQPNFLGQTPFGQPQTSQYSSSNPFVQAAQANAQGNLAGALQATAANRVNQQTPYGSLSYQQTGTDAQGNPIWSANQTVAQPYQNAINSLSGQIQQNFAQPFDTSQYQNQMVGTTPQFQGVGQAPNLQTSVQGTGMQGWDQATNLLMSRLNPQIKQQNEASDAMLANQGIMPGSEAYNRAKTQIAQQQNDLLNQAQLAGSQIQNQMFNQNLAAGNFGNTALGQQNTMNLGNTAFNNALGQQGFANQLSGTAANNAARQANFGQGLTQYQLPTASLGSLRAATTPGYVNPYNQAAVAGPDYLSAYTSQNATDIARQNAEAAQRSSLLSTLGGLGSSAILGGTGANSALGGLLGLGSQGLTALGNSSLWSSLFGNNAPAITGDTNFLNSIGLGGSTYGSGIGGMTTDPLAGLYTNGLSPEQNLSDLFNSSFGFGY